MLHLNPQPQLVPAGGETPLAGASRPDGGRGNARWELGRRPVRVNADDGPRFGLMADVSETGCLVLHDCAPPAVGMRVTLSLLSGRFLGGPGPICGIVRWVGARDGCEAFGVEFEPGSEGARRRLLFDTLLEDGRARPQS